MYKPNWGGIQVQVLSNAKNQNAGGNPANHAVQGAAGSAGPAAELRGILAEAGSSGAVLLGPVGSGRRAIFDAAVGGMDPQPRVVHLNGSTYAAHMRHGVLTFLLSQLDDGQRATRHELVHGLAKLLCTDGAPSIVTLGSASMVDSESAAILAQLAAMQKIRLVAVCERLTDLPEDVLALHRSGQLSRVTVHSMDLAQTRTFLEGELGGPISMFAAAALWHLTHSNRDVLRDLVREMVADGKLRLEAGCWVFAPGSLRTGHALTAYRSRALAGLEAGARGLLTALALGGPVSSEELRRSRLSDELTALRVRGLVTVGEAPSGTSSITVPLLGHMLRDALDEAERQETEAVLAQLHTDVDAAVVLTEVRALQELGSSEALLATVEEYAARGGFSATAWCADATRQVAILKSAAETLCALGRHEQASRQLTRSSAGLATAMGTHPNDPKLIRAAQVLRVKMARIALIEARPAAVQTLLATPSGQGHTDTGTVVGTVWASEALHVKALAVQAEAWAMMSRQREAMAIVHRILTDIEGLHLTGVLDQVLSAAECAEVECTLLRVQLLSGEWRDAGAAARRLAGGRYPDTRSVAAGELVLGVLAGLDGEADVALGMLLPTLHQLTISADSTELAAVEAATACCLAVQDRDPEAVELLLHSPSVDERRLPLNFFTWASEVFSSLAVARLDTKAAASRLVALADKASRSGSSVLEMNSLAMALRLGRIDVAGRLQQVCERSTAPVSTAFADLARGTVGADPSLLAAGLERLAQHGQTLYAGEGNNLLTESLGHRERRRVFAAVAKSRRAEAPGTVLEEKSAGPAHDLPAWLEQLTRREAQVAQHVISGLTNTAIARMSGVSVRTVEGHLYQVYSKLQVRNRQELTALDRASRRPVGIR